MQPQFIRNLDSGMRRLGFLEILLCECIKKGEHSDDKHIGESLWQWAEKNQTEFLEKLGKKRGLEKNEVGKITERTASRYAKFAMEIGFLTKGIEKELTETGRLFQRFRKKPFLIEENPGQIILVLQSLIENDKLVFLKIINKFSESKELSKKEIFDWFAKKCILDILKEVEGTDDEDLVKRLKNTMEVYTRDEKKGYDLVKHMIDTRLENLVDLGIIKKEKGKKYKSKKITHIINEEAKQENTNLTFLIFTKLFEIKEKISREGLIKEYIRHYEELSEDPIGTIHLPTLHTRLFIDTTLNKKLLITTDMIESLEEELFKKHYENVVFLRNTDGTLTHINIDIKINNKMQQGKI